MAGAAILGDAAPIQPGLPLLLNKFVRMFLHKPLSFKGSFLSVSKPHNHWPNILLWIFSIYYTLVPLSLVETLQGLKIKYTTLQAFLFGMVDTQRIGNWKKIINWLTF